MGGVVREIDLMMQAFKGRRARQDSQPDGVPHSGDKERAERNTYAQLLEMIGIVDDVDVLWRRRGGINAALPA